MLKDISIASTLRRLKSIKMKKRKAINCSRLKVGTTLLKQS